MTLALGATFISVSQLQADDWKEISFADPTIFVEHGKYYLTGTRNQEPLGFSILESTDLEHWTCLLYTSSLGSIVHADLPEGLDSRNYLDAFFGKMCIRDRSDYD